MRSRSFCKPLILLLASLEMQTFDSGSLPSPALFSDHLNVWWGAGQIVRLAAG